MCDVPISKVAVVSGALLLAAAVTVLPVEVAGAQTPSTFVGIPFNNATVSGTSQILDAGASSGVTQVQSRDQRRNPDRFGDRHGNPDHLRVAGKVEHDRRRQRHVQPSERGHREWGQWDERVGHDHGEQPASETEVIIPAKGATLDNAKGWVIDALASAGVTSVSIVATPTSGGLTPATYTATPTIYGWIVQAPAFPPCGGCIPYYIPITIQSVASFSGGSLGPAHRSLPRT